MDALWNVFITNPFGSLMFFGALAVSLYFLFKNFNAIKQRTVYIFDPRYRYLYKSDYKLEQGFLKNDSNKYPLTDFIFFELDNKFIIVAIYEAGELVPIKLYISNENRILLAIDEFKLDQHLLTNIFRKASVIEEQNNKSILEKLLDKKDVIIFSTIVLLTGIFIIVSGVSFFYSTIDKQAEAINILLEYSKLIQNTSKGEVIING